MRIYSVIGEPDFLKKALESDGENRLRLLRYRKEGRDIDRIAETIYHKMKLKKESMVKRSRS